MTPQYTSAFPRSRLAKLKSLLDEIALSIVLVLLILQWIK